MRLILMPLCVALLFLTPSRADDAVAPRTTLVADALDWYSIWGTATSAQAGTQTCRGELRDNAYSFRCDPLGVVVELVVDDSGRCSIVSMRPTVDPNDGLHVNTLAHIVPPRQKATAPTDCGELPVNKGPFSITITPRPREVNSALTRSARDAALASDKAGGGSQCVFHFPYVKTGDPFFHVYEECRGVLDDVLEFTIRNGRPADFPHWTYQGPNSLPLGAGSRLGRVDLWFGESRPEERSKAAH
jgi:hypothetical protein